MEKEISQADDLYIPMQIRILSWFGIIFGSMYLLYSVVNIILSFLDRTQGDLGSNILFLIYGLPVVIFSTGFMNKQKWGWIGYTAILGVIVIYVLLGAFSIVGTFDVYGIIIGILSLTALVWILKPSVRKLYFSS